MRVLKGLKLVAKVAGGSLAGGIVAFGVAVVQDAGDDELDGIVGMGLIAGGLLGTIKGVSDWRRR